MLANYGQCYDRNSLLEWYNSCVRTRRPRRLPTREDYTLTDLTKMGVHITSELREFYRVSPRQRAATLRAYNAILVENGDDPETDLKHVVNFFLDRNTIGFAMEHDMSLFTGIKYMELDGISLTDLASWTPSSFP